MVFSEKYGYKPEKTIQHEWISDELRNRIWNLFRQQEITAGGLSSKRIAQAINGEPSIDERIADRMGFLIEPTIKNMTAEAQLKGAILQYFDWNEVYDFIGYHLSFLPEDECMKRIEQYNRILEQEKAGYRIVAGEVAPITNESEIESIEHAAATPYPSVNQHIKKALALYADIKEPDYENSI